MNIRHAFELLFNRMNDEMTGLDKNDGTPRKDWKLFDHNF